MGLVLGELSVILDGNAAKLKGAFDGAQKAMERFATGVEGLNKKAAAVSASLSKVGLAGNKSTEHLKVSARTAEQLSSKLGVLNKTSYTTSTAWQRLGVTSMMTNANALGLASTVLKLEAAFLAAGVAAGAAFVYALSRAAAASAEDSAAIDGLTQALARTGNVGARQAAEGFAVFADELSMASRFTDGAIVKAAALGVAMGIPHEMLEEVSIAAADFSTRTGKSLGDSFETIAKAARGQGKQLAAVVGPLDEARLKSEGLGYVLERISAHMGGAAAASVQNYEGRLITTGHAFDRLVESIGAVIEKNTSVNAVIMVVGEVFSGLATIIANNRETLSSWVDFALEGFLVALKLVGKFVDWVAQKFVGLVSGLTFALAGIARFAQGVATAISGVLRVVGAGAGFLGKSDLAAKANGAADSIDGGMAGLTDSLLDVSASTFDMFKGFEDGSFGAGAALSKLEERVRKLKEEIAKGTEDKVGSPLADAPGEVPEFLKKTPTGREIVGFAPAPSQSGIAAFNTAANQARQDRILGTVQGSVGGLASNVISGAQAGAAGGPMGMVVGAGLALLTSSKQFKAILDAINPLLQAMADVLGAVLAPTREIIEAIAQPLTELMQVITPLVELFMMLNGPMLVLQVAAETLGRVISWVARGILNAIIAFLRGIQKFAKKLNISIGAIDDAIDALKGMRDSLDDAAGAAGALSEQLYNAVDGFKLASYEWEARDAEANGPGYGGGNLGEPGGVSLGTQMDALEDGVDDATDAADGMNAGGQFASDGSGSGAFAGSMVTYINIEELHATDPEDVFDEIDRIAKRKNVIRTGSPLPPSNGFGGRK